MTGPGHAPLEQRLADAAAHLDYPATPDIAGRVEARLASAPRAAAPARRWRIAALATAAAVVVAAVVAAVPASRQAVADLLGIGRARVEVVPELPPVGASLLLGERVSLAAAGDRTGAPVRIPTALGAPDGTYVDDAGRVTLVYGAGPGLPEAGGPGVGLLLERVPEDAGGFMKQATIRTDVRQVEVGGDFAIWLEGGPHAIFYSSPDGGQIESEGRLAGNTLLWLDADFTYRLEADVALERAVEIAESLE